MSNGLTGVLGGGALGLAATLRLSQAGRKVVLLEREPQLGGLAVGFQVGGTFLEKFYHHIFRTDRTIIRLIDELGLGQDLLWLRPDTSVLREGRIYSLDSAEDVLRFSPLPLPDRLRLGFALATLKAAPNEKPFGGRTAASWVRRWMGQRAYETVLGPLLVGKFGTHAEENAMSWLWSRFHERTPSLGYLRGGFQRFYSALGDRIRALGGEILLGAEAESFTANRYGVVVRTAHGRTYSFDQLLVTLPTRLFARLAEGLLPDYLIRYPGPEHLGAHVLILGLCRPLTNIYWLNIADRDFPFLALVEHTNLIPAASYGGLHLVYLGNYLPMSHELFTWNDARVLASFLPHLKRINPEFDPGWVKQHWVFKAPFAQPVVTVGYVNKLPPHRTPLPNVYLANMAHVYPQDRGQNYSLALGEKMAALMLRDATARS